MEETALLPLQGAFHTRLEDDGPLNQIITGVYDKVSEEAVKPYVVLGEDISTTFDVKDAFGENILSTLHCYSDYSGKMEAKQILNLMLKALTKEPLQVSGFSLVAFGREQMRVFSDIDGTTNHGVLQVRFYIMN